jgi:hypothetical protein
MNKLYYSKTLDNKDYYQGSLSDIIRDGDYYPSLPRFQFMLWTVVISFVFLSIYLLRIYGGETGAPPQIQDSISEENHRISQQYWSVCGYSMLCI